MHDLRRSFVVRRSDRNREWSLLLLLVVPVLTMLMGCTSALAQQTRTYFIGAIDLDWDYAPTGINQISGAAFGETENVFVQSGKERIGKVYQKAAYREFTDGTFTTLKPIDPKWQHLGILGPAIRGEVGDVIQVTFKNMTGFPASMHPHGVFYRKDSEGAPYNDARPVLMWLMMPFPPAEPIPIPGRFGSDPVPVPWMAVPSSGCITPTPTSRKTRIPAWSGRLLSRGKGPRTRMVLPRT